MKFDIKSIEEITNTAEMKQVMTELAHALADVEAKARDAKPAEQLEAEKKAERREVVRKFLNSAPAKQSLETYVKQLDLTSAGNTIEEEMSKEIIKLAIANDVFLSEIGSQTVSSTDFRQLVLKVRPDVEQTGEQDGVTTPVANTGTQNYIEVSALFAKVFAMPILTHEILRDSHIDVEGELMSLIAEEWTFKLIDMLLYGDGKKVNGIQNLRGLLWHRVDRENGFTESLKVDGARDPDYYQVIKTGVDGAFGATTEAVEDYFIDLQASLPQKYQSSAKWYMNLKTFSELKKLRTEQGFPIIEFGKFSMSGAAWGEGYILLGRPIVIVDQLPVSDSNATPVIYGDLKSAFKLVPLAGSEHFLIDDITTKGARTIYLDQRFGEIVGNSDAIRIALQAL
ncbi:MULTISPECIES: phage major capsid protein [Vibrio]|uniref:Phage major capsid protein n=1 Tax=Vibrio parahaemolyticus TaxID=670 RepID=A0AAX1FRX3_VIBPH|nr:MULTISPECIES: phage major capsid protein [Vibrio]ATI48151.1 phage major capsid protein [Vibrio parahaemolyticus]AVF60157.1 phage major capsid protein [Vibrio diabolicus]EFO40988.1 phage capsid family [Vibrio parahaemolyticus AN-5034]EGR0027443.1 phage major capsid protein [Vibrio alginolyticus]EGR2696500.1 phage major capsid protein [Vibrio parahaemolyticus]